MILVVHYKYYEHQSFSRDSYRNPRSRDAQLTHLTFQEAPERYDSGFEEGVQLAIGFV